MGHKVHRVQKKTFFKNDPGPHGIPKQVFGPHGIPKQVFLARVELVVARFGPPKIPECLENGLFSDKKWVKNGSKMCFSKNDPRPFGVHKQVK